MENILPGVHLGRWPGLAYGLDLHERWMRELGAGDALLENNVFFFFHSVRFNRELVTFQNAF